MITRNWWVRVIGQCCQPSNQTSTIVSIMPVIETAMSKWRGSRSNSTRCIGLTARSLPAPPVGDAHAYNYQGGGVVEGVEGVEADRAKGIELRYGEAEEVGP